MGRRVRRAKKFPEALQTTQNQFEKKALKAGRMRCRSPRKKLSRAVLHFVVLLQKNQTDMVLFCSTVKIYQSSIWTMMLGSRPRQPRGGGESTGMPVRRLPLQCNSKSSAWPGLRPQLTQPSGPPSESSLTAAAREPTGIRARPGPPRWLPGGATGWRLQAPRPGPDPHCHVTVSPPSRRGRAIASGPWHRTHPLQ